MKKRLTVLTFVLMLITLVLSHTVIAQDVLDVEPMNGGDVNFLNEVFEANPTVKVFRLVSTDMSYFFSSVTNVDRDFEIIGVPDPVTGRIPCIQPFLLEDGSVPERLLDATVDGITVKLTNLYLLAKANSGDIAPPPADGSGDPDPGVLSINADNISVEIDNSVLDSWHHFSVYNLGANTNFKVTNTIHRNFVQPGNHLWVGEGFRHLDSTQPLGDVFVQNNTFLNVGAYVALVHTLNNLNKSFVFDHNTVAFGTKNPLFNFMGTDLQITNNIFYGTFAAGQGQGSFNGGWDESDAKTQCAVLSMDTLSAKISGIWGRDQGIDTTNSAALEAARKVVVKNNACYWPKSLSDFWTAFNDTASAANKRVFPVWMNERTKGLFADKTTWPGFVEEGNHLEDPGFSADIENIVTTGGLNDYLHNAFIATGRTETAIYGYGVVEPSGDINWKPEWPVKENLAYTNETYKTAGSDGFPIGDLNWFPDSKTQWITGVEVVDTEIPSTFTLDQNYPNPFNPSTKISFGIVEEGNVSLKVYSVNGELVSTLVNNEKLSAGTYVYTVDMTEYSSGVYFYTLISDNKMATKKMVLVK